jgi:hypothetical protein
MKDTYKPPHTSLDNMTTHSTIGRLDFVEDQLKKLQENINGLDEKWDKKLDKNWMRSWRKKFNKT